jgi:hypothetical protein
MISLYLAATARWTGLKMATGDLDLKHARRTALVTYTTISAKRIVSRTVFTARPRNLFHLFFYVADRVLTL